MKGLLITIVTFLVIFKVIDIIVMAYKDKRKGHIKGKYHKIYKYDEDETNDQVIRVQRSEYWKASNIKNKSNQNEKNGYRMNSLIKSMNDGLIIDYEPKKLEKEENLYLVENKPYSFEDNKPKGEITRFKRPDSFEIPSVQEELKETVWNKDFLISIEWKVFEDVCAEYLRLKNCNGNVTNTGKDGGIDLKVTDKAGNVIALGQCKAWSKPVGVSLVRELYGIMAAENVRHGVYITTSTFTNDALAFANNKKLVLINGDDFIKNINTLEEKDQYQITNVATVEGYTIPTCASCNIKMVKRTAQKGNNSGGLFWGCRNFPRCRNKLQVRKEVNAF